MLVKRVVDWTCCRSITRFIFMVTSVETVFPGCDFELLNTL